MGHAYKQNINISTNWLGAEEFTARTVIEWLKGLGVAPLFIEPWSPWENCYIKSFNVKLRYGLLDAEIFTLLVDFVTFSLKADPPESVEIWQN